MKAINVALLGLGTVGKGVYQTINTHQERLRDITGCSVHVSTFLIEHPEKHATVNGTTVTDIRTITENPDIDIVFEAIVGKEPAFSYLKKCIQAGKHVITANKEMFAVHGKELRELARQHHVSIGYDATTAGGIPIIQMIQHVLQANNVLKVQAILNGTTNYILTEMRDQNAAFEDALQQAQQLGYAEADPTNDVEGFDAFYKLMILSELIYNEQPNWNDVKRIGITSISEKDIAENQLTNKRIKHIASIWKEDGRILAKVEPVSLPRDHPLYAIEGVDNAINIETDILGELTLKGPGAGALPTASAMIEDFCLIYSGKSQKEKSTVVVS
ncbi:homoserine dehydrogenase [Virgibacillus sp. C22-A2]|uniref:Homoserine dehydrogenase n=1 Tax=Virgibacillus tibetensis TaxID=3042313 RepID=A0ABU6KGU9_9BACI|nr:homoserine dehydrogenase [Virgibacillus sp. C22-A2]